MTENISVFRKPDFLICGGQRCGTTFLAESLHSQINVHLASPMKPEPKFFLRESTDRSFKAYCDKYFKSFPLPTKVGEKSTSYLDEINAAQRIHEVIPDARLIFSFRHPVERAVSNYFFSKSHGLETLDFGEAIRDEASRTSENYHATSVHPNAYAARGMYVTNLRRFLKHFDMTQIKIILFEDLETMPSRTIASVLRFLGIRASANSIPLSSNINNSRSNPLYGEKETLNHLLEYFSESNKELAEMLGRDLSAWNELSPRLKALLPS